MSLCAMNTLSFVLVPHAALYALRLLETSNQQGGPLRQSFQHRPDLVITLCHHFLPALRRPLVRRRAPGAEEQRLFFLLKARQPLLYLEQLLRNAGGRRCESVTRVHYGCCIERVGVERGVGGTLRAIARPVRRTQVLLAAPCWPSVEAYPGRRRRLCRRRRVALSAYCRRLASHLFANQVCTTTLTLSSSNSSRLDRQGDDQP